MTTSQFEALLERSSSGFGERALEAGLVDVAVTTIDTAVGTLLLASTEDGIVRVAFDVEDHPAVLEQLAAAISPRVVEHVTPLLAEGRRQLEEYFAGTRTTFELALDLRLARGPYRREVLGLLASIPAGATRTYAEVAILSGRPRAVRAVGSGCAGNPLPVLVPCHRVLRTGGEVGGYIGGTHRKRWLLEHERRIAG